MEMEGDSGDDDEMILPGLIVGGELQVCGSADGGSGVGSEERWEWGDATT